MRSRPRAAICAIVLPLSALTGCTPAPVVGSGHQLVFEDQFDGDELGAFWANAPFGGGLPATVEDGVLTLTTRADNDYRWGYVASTGPRVDGGRSYPFSLAWEGGYFEARIRYTDDPWAWPAFWLFSMSKTEAWPDEDCTLLNAEWDIIENGVSNANGDQPASNWYVSALHRNTTDNTDDGYCGVPDDIESVIREYPDTRLSDWHTWGGRWTAEELCTYLDGVEIQCMAPFDSTAQPMHLVFTMQYLGACRGCPPRPDSLEMHVDWVRVWQVPHP